MMQLKYFFIILILSGLCSCIKQENGDFQLEYRMRIELPADANPILTHKFEQRIASYWIQFLNKNNLEQKDIKKVSPRSIILTPVFDNSISYEIISEAHVSIYPINKLNENIPIADIEDPNPLINPDEFIFPPGLAD